MDVKSRLPGGPGNRLRPCPGGVGLFRGGIAHEAAHSAVSVIPHAASPEETGLLNVSVTRKIRVVFRRPGKSDLGQLGDGIVTKFAGLFSGNMTVHPSDVGRIGVTEMRRSLARIVIPGASGSRPGVQQRDRAVGVVERFSHFGTGSVGEQDRARRVGRHPPFDGFALPVIIPEPLPHVAVAARAAGDFGDIACIGMAAVVVCLDQPFRRAEQDLRHVAVITAEDGAGGHVEHFAVVGTTEPVIAGQALAAGAGIGIHVAAEPVTVIFGVSVIGHTELLQVRSARGALGSFAGRVQRGQEHSGQNGDDGDDHQQLDEGKGVEDGPGGNTPREQDLRLHFLPFCVSRT